MTYTQVPFFNPCANLHLQDQKNIRGAQVCSNGSYCIQKNRVICP